MARYKVKYNQNIFDLAIQLYGDTSGIGDLLSQNPHMNLGYEPRLGEIVSYDDSKIINRSAVRYLSDNHLIVSNGYGSVYYKETSEELKMTVLVDKEKASFSMSISGVGSVIIDWGDNSSLKTYNLTSDVQQINHDFDSQLPDSENSRRIRLYGGFFIDELTIGGSGVEGVYTSKTLSIFNLHMPDNGALSDLSFLRSVDDLGVIDVSKSNISPAPLISRVELSDIYINDCEISQQDLDDYLIGVVNNYGTRDVATLKMWGNDRPSGTYQEPTNHSYPQSGMEAMWVLINVFGWTITDIISPPSYANLVGRFTSRDGVVAIDSILSNDSAIHLPVTKFNSSNNSFFYAPDLDSGRFKKVKFKFLVPSYQSSFGTIVGIRHSTNEGVSVSLNSDGTVFFESSSGGSVSSVVSYRDNSIHTLTLDLSRDDVSMCYIDDDIIGSITRSPYSANETLSFGCALDLIGPIPATPTPTRHSFSDVYIWDVDINNGASVIPIPHLMYDVKRAESILNSSNMEEYFLPTNIMGVSNDGGSDYMIRNGAVRRIGTSANLISDGASVKSETAIVVAIDSIRVYWESEQIPVSGQGGGVDIDISIELSVSQEVLDTFAGTMNAVSIRQYDEDGNPSTGNTTFGTSYVDTGWQTITGTVTLNDNTRYVDVITWYLASPGNSGEVFARNASMTKNIDKFIPNNESKTPLLPLEGGDTTIDGSDFLNATPFEIVFEHSIWDKTSTDVWNNSVRTSSNHDPLIPKKWSYLELTNGNMSELIKTDYANVVWIKMLNNEFIDIFHYSSPLTGVDLSDCNRYIN